MYVHTCIYIYIYTYYTHVCTDEEANNMDNFVIVPRKSHAPAEAKLLGSSLEWNLMIDLLGLSREEGNVSYWACIGVIFYSRLS